MQFSNVVCFLIVMFTLNRSSAAVGPGAIIGGIAGGIGAGGAVVGSAKAIIGKLYVLESFIIYTKVNYYLIV